MEMKYSGLVNKRKQYKYSANIRLDIKNDSKLAEFIPNSTTIEILKDYLYGILNPGNKVHSRILYGSYGTGKSHLLTVICDILGQLHIDGEGYKTFIESISYYGDELPQALEEFVKESKPFLVVPVYTDFDSFEKCITFSLKKELEKNNIDICFKSYFDEAIDLLYKWQENDDSNERLKEVSKREKVKINELLIGLKNFDSEYEKKFDLIFKGMSYGGSFVSTAGNLLDNIELANTVIADSYRGIVFIFDEFGRYVEDYGESIRVKAIQDLAEYCDHSDYEDYLIMVSHKQLSLYTEKFSKSVNEEWKKIEGRFNATSINTKYDQCLSLISHIIPKTVEWKKFAKKYKKQLEQIYDQAWDFKGFLLPPEGGNPFEGGFPLHPITLYSLDRLSKKVAQNERTFFTYLSSDEDNSLFALLDKYDTKAFHFVGLDSLFDYFEENIKAYRSTEVYEIYKKLQFAINKIGLSGDNTLQIKILKAMTVIAIIADTSVLAADRATLCNVIDGDNQDISNALDSLEEKKVIRYMRQYSYYDFLDSSIYDLDSMIQEKIDSISEESIINVLNDEFADFVVLPYEYNGFYKTNRVFTPIYVNRTDITKKSFLRLIPDYYDGIIAMVFDDDYDIEYYSENKKAIERAVFLVNTEPKDLQNEIKRYIAIKYYYSIVDELKKADPTVEKEILLYLEEQKGVISELIDRWKLIDLNTIKSVYNGKEFGITGELQLNDLASEIMYESFPSTIIVNNDLINKNSLSGAMKLARNKVLEVLINSNENVSFQPMSPEHTVYRSVLALNGLNDDEGIIKLNYLKNKVLSGKCVKEEIDKFLKKTKKGKQCFADLYDVLKKPPYGLRDGYISVLIANELIDYSNVSLYFHSIEREYSAEELLNALDSPGDYWLYSSDWSESQEKYIVSLENIFKDYINVNAKNRLKELFNGMNAHFSSISKSARTTDKYVSDKTKQYRDVLSISYKDYNKFFFEALPELNEDLGDLSIIVCNAVAELNGVVDAQVIRVINIIKSVLNAESDNRKLADLLSEKYEKEWNKKSHKSFGYHTNSFLDFVRNIDCNRDDYSVVESLSNIYTGFEIEYWNDSKDEDFYELFSKSIQELTEYDENKELNENEVKLTLKVGSEEEKITQFDNGDLSVNGTVVYNKINKTLSDFGESVSYDEKMAILAKIISEMF